MTDEVEPASADETMGDIFADARQQAVDAGFQSKEATICAEGYVDVVEWLETPARIHGHACGYLNALSNHHTSLKEAGSAPPAADPPNEFLYAKGREIGFSSGFPDTAAEACGGGFRDGYLIARMHLDDSLAIVSAYAIGYAWGIAQKIADPAIQSLGKGLLRATSLGFQPSRSD